MAKYVSIQNQVQLLSQKQKEIQLLQNDFTKSYISFLNEIQNNVKQPDTKELDDFMERVIQQQEQFQKTQEDRMKKFEKFINEKRQKDKSDLIEKIKLQETFFKKLVNIQNDNSKKLQILLEKTDQYTLADEMNQSFSLNLEQLQTSTFFEHNEEDTKNQK